MTKNGHIKGFRFPEENARLVFEGDYEGAEVVVRLDVPVGVYMILSALAGGEDAGEVGKALEVFSRDVLVSWNIEGPDGAPLPADMALAPMAFAMLIMEQWAEAVNNRRPLAVGSSA